MRLKVQGDGSYAIRIETNPAVQEALVTSGSNRQGIHMDRGGDDLRINLTQDAQSGISSTFDTATGAVRNSMTGKAPGLVVQSGNLGSITFDGRDLKLGASARPVARADGRELELTVTLPPGSDVDIQAPNLRETIIDGDLAKVQVKSTSGKVKLNATFQHADITSMTNSVSVAKVPSMSTLSIEAMTGDITVDDFSGSGSLKSTTGFIKVKKADPQGKLGITTTIGKIDVTAVDRPDAREKITIDTDSEQIKLRWARVSDPTPGKTVQRGAELFKRFFPNTKRRPGPPR